MRLVALAEDKLSDSVPEAFVEIERDIPCRARYIRVGAFGDQS